MSEERLNKLALMQYYHDIPIDPIKLKQNLLGTAEELI